MVGRIGRNLSFVQRQLDRVEAKGYVPEDIFDAMYQVERELCLQFHPVKKGVLFQFKAPEVSGSKPYTITPVIIAGRGGSTMDGTWNRDSLTFSDTTLGDFAGSDVGKLIVFYSGPYVAGVGHITAVNSSSEVVLSSHGVYTDGVTAPDSWEVYVATLLTNTVISGNAEKFAIEVDVTVSSTPFGLGVEYFGTIEGSWDGSTWATVLTFNQDDDPVFVGGLSYTSLRMTIESASLITAVTTKYYGGMTPLVPLPDGKNTAATILKLNHVGDTVRLDGEDLDLVVSEADRQAITEDTDTYDPTGVPEFVFALGDAELEVYPVGPTSSGVVSIDCVLGPGGINDDEEGDPTIGPEWDEALRYGTLARLAGGEFDARYELAKTSVGHSKHTVLQPTVRIDTSSRKLGF